MSKANNEPTPSASSAEYEPLDGTPEQGTAVGEARRLDAYSADAMTLLIEQTAMALPQYNNSEEHRQTQCIQAAGLLSDLRPQDAVEAMIASQMVVMHCAVMDSFLYAALPKQAPETKGMHLAHAAKLSATFTRLADALDRRRGQGQSAISVGYVNVQSGANAVVGTVSRRDDRK